MNEQKRPMPGDVVELTQKWFGAEAGETAVIEGRLGQVEDGYSFTFNASAFRHKGTQGSVSCSGGPGAIWVDARNLKPTGRTKVQRFWCWNENGAGRGNGEDYELEVDVWAWDGEDVYKQERIDQEKRYEEEAERKKQAEMLDENRLGGLSAERAAKRLFDILADLSERIGTRAGEVALLTPEQSKQQGFAECWRVMWEAGPYEWGVILSLDGTPPGFPYIGISSGGWYLQPHYGFDVGFVEED